MATEQAASAARPGATRRPGIGQSIVLTLLTVAVAAVWPALWARQHRSITALLALGRSGGPSVPAILRDLPHAFVFPNGGHDGRFFYVIARHPFSFSHNAHLLDVPAYRYRRILFPTIAGWLAPHGGTALIWAFLLVSLVGVAIGAFAMTRFPHAPIWLPLTVAADPGVIAAQFITLSDALATGLVLAGFALMFRRRWGWVTVLLVLAALTRETTLLAAFSLAFWPRLPTRARLVVAGVPAAALAAWALFVAAATHTSATQAPSGGLFTFPLAGWVHGVSGLDLAISAAVALLLVLALALPRRVPLTFPLYFAVNLLMLVCSTNAIAFAWIDATRVVAPRSRWRAGCSAGRGSRGVGRRTWWRSADHAQLPLEVLDLVAQPRRVLEAEVGGRLVHLLLEGADEAPQLLLGELGELAALRLLRGAVACGARRRASARCRRPGAGS